MREPFAEQAEIGVHDGDVRKRGERCKGRRFDPYPTFKRRRYAKSR